MRYILLIDRLDRQHCVPESQWPEFQGQCDVLAIVEQVLRSSASVPLGAKTNPDTVQPAVPHLQAVPNRVARNGQGPVKRAKRSRLPSGSQKNLEGVVA